MRYQQDEDLREYNILFREMDELYHELAAGMGLSDSAFFILYAIAEIGDGCLQKDISDRYFLSKKTIHSSIQNLKLKGYLTLEQGKGRNRHIHLTEAGERLMNDKILPVMEMESQALADMSQEERSQMLSLMRKYIQLFREKTENFEALK